MVRKLIGDAQADSRHATALHASNITPLLAGAVSGALLAFVVALVFPATLEEDTYAFSVDSNGYTVQALRSKVLVSEAGVVAGEGSEISKWHVTLVHTSNESVIVTFTDSTGDGEPDAFSAGLFMDGPSGSLTPNFLYQQLPSDGRDASPVQLRVVFRDLLSPEAGWSYRDFDLDGVLDARTNLRDSQSRERQLHFENTWVSVESDGTGEERAYIGELKGEPHRFVWSSGVGWLAEPIGALQ